MLTGSIFSPADITEVEISRLDHIAEGIVQEAVMRERRTDQVPTTNVN
jgi:hypothetical protein